MRLLKLALLSVAASLPILEAQSVAYLHGDVASDGTVPSGAAAPFHQMLLSDEGKRGLSRLKSIVEREGFVISQHYDREVTLDAAFLSRFEVLIFGLHQKKWSDTERKALHEWLQSGGGLLIYSDSAAGGFHREVGLKNPVGQTSVNLILTRYGMQTAVDQAGGTRAYRSPAKAAHPITRGGLILEGEGVSPIAIDPEGPARALINFDEKHRVSNKALRVDPVGVTIANPVWAALAHVEVGKGNIIALFDRQPLWNNGEGSDITRRDNQEIMRRIVVFLADEAAK